MNEVKQKPMTQRAENMSLRDYFAGCALQSVAENIDLCEKKEDLDAIAGVTYMMADAMIKAREIKEESKS